MAKKKSKKGLIIFLFVIVIIIIAAAMFFMNKKGDNAVKVQTGEVTTRSITQIVSAIGKIKPETEVKISSETSGEIIFLGVNVGDTVRRGDLLVKIKPDIIETQLEQQKAASQASKMNIDVRKAELDRAEAELKRTNELYKKEFASKQELDAAKAAYESANSAYQASLASYEQAQAMLKQVQRSAERTTIMAPMDGIVTLLEVEEGEKVVGTEMMQGTEMMRISDLSVMNAVVEVDENDIVLVSLGDTTNIEIDAFPDEIFRGTVLEIGHSAIQSSVGTQEQVTNFEVKVRILNEDPRLRPGMSCNVEIETETHYNVMAVPLQSVTVRAGNMDSTPDVVEDNARVRKVNSQNGIKKVERPPSVVFSVDGNKAKLNYVETGISDKGFIEIMSGLEEGQKIITGSFSAVSKELKDGSEIIEDNMNKRKNFK